MASSYPVINNIPCSPESEVSFRTFNRLDSQTYRGVIVGVVNFDTARLFGSDVVATHENMETDIAKQDIASQTFVLVRTTDKVTRPFAVCWINSNTFRRTDTLSDVSFTIHNINPTEAFRIANYIRDLGYDVTQN